MCFIALVVYRGMVNETYLRKEFVHFAARTVFQFAEFEIVLVAEEVIAEQGVVQERLQNHVEKTGLAEIQ
jgi:hypothetical protein